jgi:transcriptional regulator with XRE-family HTH domain
MAVVEDDERLAQLLRLLRRRGNLTQAQLADRAGIPRRVVQLIEGGNAQRVRLGDLRRSFDGVDARARLTTWWRGAAADRLLDARHAELAEHAIRVLQLRDWLTKSEVTFSEYGERGSIDIFGAHERRRAVLVGEVKSDIGSLEETNRVLDAKERLAPKLAIEHFGFMPRFIGRLLILPDEMRLRRLIERHAATMGSVYPARGRDVRAWLRHPEHSIRGIWFLSDARPASVASS